VCFDLSKQTCCGSDKTPDGFVLYDGLGISCCGSTGYNASTSTCCNNGTVDHGLKQICAGVCYDKGFLCCASHGYNPQNSSCCLNKVYDGAKVTICGQNQCFDQDRQTCCFGNVFNISSKVGSCCGTGAYDQTTSHCCNKSVITVGKEPSLCGSECFDPLAQTCCSDNMIIDRVNFNCPTTTTTSTTMASTFDCDMADDRGECCSVC
jgi:hypothetical protein